MLIEFECPHCRTGLKAGSNLAGTKGECPSCKKPLTVPVPDEEPSKKRPGKVK